MMDKYDIDNGTSLFGRSFELMEDDPLEEIFALNLGDFISEHLISDDLAKKIGESSKDSSKTDNLKKQLKELIDIYSLDNTLCVLGFDSEDDYIIYNSIAKTISQMLEVDACHVYLTRQFAKGLCDNKNDLVLVGSSLELDDDIYSRNIGYKFNDNSFVSNAFNKKEKIEVKYPNNAPNFVPIEDLNEDKVEVFTAIPMHNNAYTVGVVVVQSYKDKFFEVEYVELISSIARLFATSMSLQLSVEQAANIIDSQDSTLTELQHMRAELTALIGDLSDDQQVFVQRLARAVDAKGHYTVAHSEQTADLAKLICADLGLNEKTADLVYYAGLLQNIGKITLSSELFSHGGKLTKSDWEKLQNHPNVGVNLLMNINFLSEVVPYIHYHKERWDGRGEPEGLSGLSIPLGSRIIAVADAYSALISDRPFREALGSSEALSIMKEEAKLKWDPTIVDSLERVVSNN